MVISFKTIQNRQNLSHPAPLKACRFVQAARAQSRIDHHPTIVASAYAVIAFLCTYLAQGAMQALVKAMPAWLTHGFEVAGGILPAVGFGLLLRVMFKAQYIPYLIAGFLFVCYIQVSNLLPVAVLGAGFAVYEFFNAKSRQQAQPQPVASKNEEEDYSNGL